VAGAHQRRGVGRQLVDALTEKARAVGLRTIVSGTQNTNIPAIRVYRRVGFHIEGIDLSYYSNDDYPDGEIALFMKKGSCRRIFPSIMLNERRTKFDHYLTRHDAYAAWGNIIEQIAVREKVSNYLLENQR
jgi:ribosomal protein S18 acetylase RimI-like enzyme